MAPVREYVALCCPKQSNDMAHCLAFLSVHYTLRKIFLPLNVKPSQIHYFEHNSRKVIISTDQGEYLGNYTLKELSSKFRPYFFDSPHKSYLVNLNHIRYIKGFDIYLDSGTILPLAQKKAVYFKSLFQQFQEKRLEII